MLKTRTKMSDNNISNNKVGQDEFYNLVTSNEVSWQAIIYDLINTEQLNPWDIDLVILTKKYLEKVRLLEEANFFVSSKVLLAASLLLRIKSEILLNHYIKSIDEVLYGKKEISKIKPEFNVDLGEIPELFMKTPLPRYRRVSLQELMGALEKAMSTENRRIKRQVLIKQYEKEAEIVLPRRTINIRERIRGFYARVLTTFNRKQTRISYAELTNNNPVEKKSCFLPALHLDTQQRIVLEQEQHFEDIWVWTYKHYKKQIGLTELKNEIDIKKEELDKEEIIDEITGFDNPLANFFGVEE